MILHDPSANLIIWRQPQNLRFIRVHSSSYSIFKPTNNQQPIPLAWEVLSLSSSKARPKRKGPNLQRLRCRSCRIWVAFEGMKQWSLESLHFGLGDKLRMFFSKKLKTKKSMRCAKKWCLLHVPDSQPSKPPYHWMMCRKTTRNYPFLVPCQVASCTWGCEAARKLQHPWGMFPSTCQSNLLSNSEVSTKKKKT